MSWRHGFAAGLICLMAGCGGEPVPPPAAVQGLEEPTLDVEQGTKSSTPGLSTPEPAKDAARTDSGNAKPSDATPPDPIGDLPK